MNIQFFSTDIDGTILGKPDALNRFTATWSKIPDQHRPLLCYNTGRLLEDLQNLVEEEHMPRPDYLICGVGTRIFDVGANRILKSFNDILDEGWNLNQVQQVLESHSFASLQPIQFQSKYKSSWYAHGLSSQDLLSLEQELEHAGLDVHVVYSSDRDLDILPKYANKGNALTWLLKQLNIARKACLVAGDTGNDAAMFLKKDIRGIVVGNAQPELQEATIGKEVYRAEGACADGVLEGLRHFGVIESVEEAPAHLSQHSSTTAPNIRRMLDDMPDKSLSTEERDFLKIAYQKAIEGLKKCMTEKGFSACSLQDNDSSGTDENYFSVWARDGSITVIGSLGLNDPEIIACQQKTLETLLENISLTGQVPANVHIETGIPDYSGVGGICSIDSGIWLVIACFEYAKARGDLNFIRNHRGHLQKIMDWLSAHDSNNDGLLEIPEAGDWTDLFGRSYHVLYDEVLWYRANVCFGRMLELLGDWKMAGDYLRWASSVKSSILHKFYPSTSSASDSYAFYDNQASLGDTHYLIAQVTPFDFDWRLDVYANVMAFLYDVLDIEKAQKAFRFMWGVGVNQPHPVVNLYPPVQAGDPGWRHYYTVNLLNLPDHYHNGGIWPFIGAQWVRYIHKLGFRELALKELVNLAHINQKGIRHEWEFNEWAHGKTGQPMGKAFQAWSCSEFIKACHALKIER